MALVNNGSGIVFCDWLDVTMPPDREHDVRAELGPLLCAAGFGRESDDLYRVDGGTVRLTANRGWFKVGISGQSCAMLRLHGVWTEVLFVLGSGPHRVTRVDCALDIPMDGADAIERLQAVYPSGHVRLSQRPVRITEVLSTRSDGRKSGSWYAGRRGQSEVTCRVYDKALEALEKRGEDLPPRTRCELTVCKGVGPTLRDAAEPERLFWHYMAPAILPRPEGVPAWDSGWAEGWVMDRVEVLAAERLRRRIQESPELAALIELADSLGPGGRQYALGLIQLRFGRHGAEPPVPLPVQPTAA